MEACFLRHGIAVALVLVNIVTQMQSQVEFVRFSGMGIGIEIAKTEIRA